MLLTIYLAASLPQASLELCWVCSCVPKLALLWALGTVEFQALGVTRDAEIEPGDKICETDIYREW